ncbi:hypothetical protein B0H13DRAFT_1888539 [Mycena leptocephala]|nr:hypothetical protein B0H13DRAFT_1888539 [Mycena leptocephala]
MAEWLANKAAQRNDGEKRTSPSITLGPIPGVKIERRDARIDELGGELSGLRDALIIAQKHRRQRMRNYEGFQNSKSANPPREDVEPRDPGQGTARQLRTARKAVQQGVWNGICGCYYCDGQDHFAKECTVKAAHIHKGWIVVEDGQQKLADGIYSEREGTCSDSSEEYWQRKSAMQAQVQPYSNQAAPTPTVNMEELGRTVFNMIKLGGAAQDQYIQTRRFLEAPRMEARTRPKVSKPPEGSKSENTQERNRDLPYPKTERRVPGGIKKAYELKAPVQMEGLADELLERINNTEVTVKLGDLFGMSRDLREGEKLQLTRTRQPIKEQEPSRPLNAVEVNHLRW